MMKEKVLLGLLFSSQLLSGSLVALAEEPLALSTSTSQTVDTQTSEVDASTSSATEVDTASTTSDGVPETSSSVSESVTRATLTDLTTLPAAIPEASSQATITLHRLYHP